MINKSSFLLNKNYRPDIEGMRAIAIILVIASHFQMPGFSAGFIGVDIFFVISGYLITSILIKEHEENGAISFSRFYANRLRRLLPALATTIVISSIAAYYIIPESENIAHSKAAAAAILWISNIYFSFADIDYFDIENSQNIFLHTWSLGVEEQFYLLWPVLMASILLITSKSKKITRMISILASISILSFAGCIYYSLHDPKIAFYMMPTRAWQFSTGALAWLISIHINQNSKTTSLASFSGLSLILFSILKIDDNSVYPSLYALLPTLGTALLLFSFSSKPKKNILYIFISNKAMQKIGNISYSWYLWHWPVLIIGQYLAPIKGDLGNSFIAISISLLIAFITYNVIENPFRFGKPSHLKPRWQIISASALIVLINSQILQWNNKLHDSLNSGFNQFVSSSIYDTPFIYSDGCDTWYHNSDLRPCIYGNESAENTAVLMGDSIAAQWFSALTHMHTPDKWKIIVLTKSACPMVNEPYFYERIGREYSECSEWRNKAIEWINNIKADRLFIGSSAFAGFTDKQWKEGTRSILQSFNTVKSIYFIEPSPSLPFNGPGCLIKNKNHQDRMNNCRISLSNEAHRKVTDLLKKTVDKFDNVHWLQTASFVCPDKICNAMIETSDGNEIIVFRDSQHITNSFAITAAPYFKRQVEAYEHPINKNDD